MNDLQVLTAMFDRAGIRYTTSATVPVEKWYPAGTTLKIESGDRRNYGYMFFYTEIYFDETGALFAMGAYE